MLWLVVLGLLLSLADAAFLLVVADHVGALTTVVLVVVTAALGVVLVRSQGRSTLARIQRRLAAGEPPTNELIDGAMIIFGAALLLTPGLLTDVTGFLLVIPFTRVPLRYVLRRWIVGPWIRKKMEDGSINVQIGGSFGSFGVSGGSGAGAPWEEVDEGPWDDPKTDGDDDYYELDDDEYEVDEDR